MTNNLRLKAINNHTRVDHTSQQSQQSNFEAHHRHLDTPGLVFFADVRVSF